MASEVADDVVLALHEAASNAVLHGSSARQPVEVALRVTEQCIEASVLDHGPDPPAQPPADADAKELSARGRGLWLLHGQVIRGAGRAADRARREVYHDWTSRVNHTHYSSVANAARPT